MPPKIAIKCTLLKAKSGVMDFQNKHENKETTNTYHYGMMLFSPTISCSSLSDDEEGGSTKRLMNSKKNLV